MSLEIQGFIYLILSEMVVHSLQLFGQVGCQQQFRPLGDISRDFSLQVILFYILQALLSSQDAGAK